MKEQYLEKGSTSQEMSRWDLQQQQNSSRSAEKDCYKETK